MVGHVLVSQATAGGVLQAQLEPLAREVEFDHAHQHLGAGDKPESVKSI